MTRVVVDANVVILSLIANGLVASVFSLNSALRKFEFVAPEFLLEEVKRHREKIIKCTRLSAEDFEEAHDFLLGEITFVPAAEFASFIPAALEITPDKKDTPYVALALALKCPLFTGDKALGNIKGIEALPPRQMLNLLSHGTKL